MRGALVLVTAALAACGRVGFDGLGGNDGAGPSDGAGGDGMPDGGPTASGCAANYVYQFGTSWYRLGSPAETWLVAEQLCEADGPGSHLAVIESSQELAALFSFNSIVQVWTGSSQRTTLGVWRHVTGAVATYLPWNAGFPMSGAGRDCVQWYDRFAVGVVYENTAENSALPYTCECDGVPPDPAAF